jgi:hypothetical protein
MQNKKINKEGFKNYICTLIHQNLFFKLSSTKLMNPLRTVFLLLIVDLKKYLKYRYIGQKS